MLKLGRANYEVVYDDTFPSYFKATNEQLESALYEAEYWNDSDETVWNIVTFDDIRSDFESWTPEERAEYLGDDDVPEYDVHDWIRDCMMNSLAVVKDIRKKGETK